MAAEPMWEKELSIFPREGDMNEACLLLESDVTVMSVGGVS